MPIERLRASLPALKFLGLAVAVCGTGLSISVCSIGLGLYAAAFAAEFALVRGAVRPAFPNAKLALALLASLAVSVLVSEYKAVSARGYFKYIEGLVLLYACVDTLRTPRDFRRLAAVFFGVLAVATLAGIAQDVWGRDFVYFREAIVYRGDIMRIRGPFKHSNDYAEFLVPGIAAAVGAAAASWASGRKATAGALAALAASSAAALARTLSRGAYVAAFFAFLALAARFRKKALFAAGSAVLLAALLLIPSDFSARLRESFDPSAGTTPERVILLKTTAAMVRARPVFGLGLNTYSDNFPKYRPDSYKDIMYAHNTYLQIASEAGLLGLSLLLAFIASLLIRAARSLRAGGPGSAAVAGVWSGAAGFLVNGFFDSSLQSTQLRTYFWILVGVCVAWDSAVRAAAPAVAAEKR